jgi:ribosomal protein S18 acetylase RimI-like enzyme
MVAVDNETGDVVGFAQLLSDGEIQVLLAMIAVAESHRRLGIARRLLDAGLQRAGGQRVDLLSEDDAGGFYEALQHRPKQGFRPYPPFAKSDG